VGIWPDDVELELHDWLQSKLNAWGRKLGLTG
jgi:hypothetical protein